MFKIQPKQKAIEKLFEFSKSKGYVSFNDILDAVDFFDLTINEVDSVSEQLLTLGCVIKEVDDPTIQVKFDFLESELNSKSNMQINRINEKTINKKNISDEIVVQSIKENKVVCSLNEEELFEKIMELFDENRLLEAIKYCDIAIDIYPDTGWGYYQKAVILIDLEKYQQALELCDIAFEKSYIKEHCCCAKAIILAHLNKYDESIKFYNKALEINSENICALTNLSVIMNKLGDYSQEVEYLKKVIEIEPTNIECINDLAVAYHNMNDFKQAEVYYDRVISIDSKYSNAYYNKGLIVEERGNNDNALKLYNKAIENNNQNTDAYYAKGRILRKMNMNTKAIKYFMKVINLDSEYIEAYKSAGEIFLDKNNYEYALANYNKAIELNPNDANCYLNKGICLQNLKKYSDAEDCFRKSIILDSKEQLNYFHMAYVLDVRRKYEEAVNYYNKAIMLNPDDIAAYNNKGYTLFKMKKYEEAIKCYDKALEIDSEYKLSIVNKKNALKKLKQEATDFDSIKKNENKINNTSSYLDQELNKGDNIEFIREESKKIQRSYFYILKLYKNGYYIDCRKELSKFFSLNNKLINNIELNQKYTIIFILISFGELDLALKEFNKELLLDASSNCEFDLINKIKRGETNNIQEFINDEKIHYTFQDAYTINFILVNICNYYCGDFPSNIFFEQTNWIRKEAHNKNINEKYSENYLEANDIDKNLLTNCENKEISEDSNNESYSNKKNNLIEQSSFENNKINETNIQDLYKEIIYLYNKKNYAECKEKLMELLNNTYESIGKMNSNQTYTMIFLSVPFGIMDMVIKKVNIELIGRIGGFKYDLMMKIVKNDTLGIQEFINDRKKFYHFEDSDTNNLILDNIINYYKGKSLIREEKQEVHNFDSIEDKREEYKLLERYNLMNLSNKVISLVDNKLDNLECVEAKEVKSETCELEQGDNTKKYEMNTNVTKFDAKKRDEDKKSSAFEDERERLRKIINDRFHVLTLKQKQIAEFLVENLEEVANCDTKTKLAKLNNTSESTVRMTFMRLRLTRYKDLIFKLNVLLDQEPDKRRKLKETKLTGEYIEANNIKKQEKNKLEEKYNLILDLYKNELYNACKEELFKLLHFNDELINTMENNSKYTILFIFSSFGKLDIALKKFDFKSLCKSSCKDFEYLYLDKVRKREIYDIKEYIRNRKKYYNFQDKDTINLIVENIINYYKGIF